MSQKPAGTRASADSYSITVAPVHEYSGHVLHRFKCEICEASGVGLTIGLHKDILEYPTPTTRLIFFGFGRGDARLYVLCRVCLERCEDLLHPERREHLKAEFVAQIRNGRTYSEN